MSEFTKILRRRLVVGVRGFFGGSVCAELNEFSIHSNQCPPLLPVQENTLESTSSSFLSSSIHRILQWRAFAKILPSIVERIAIFMVAKIKSVTQTKNKTMHSHSTIACAIRLRIICNRIKAVI